MSESYTLFNFVVIWLSLSLCVFGLISNLVSILIYSHTVMRAPINVLLVGLSTIDFFMCILAMGAFCVPGLASYYEDEHLKNFQHYAAVYIYPFTMIAQTCSVWTFLVITFERFVAVCFPLKARGWCTIKRSLRALSIVALLAILYNIPRFLEYELIVLQRDPLIVEAKSRLRNATVHRTYMSGYYCSSYLITHFLIPFTILVLVNSFMIRTVYKAHRERSLLSNQEKREHKTAFMMILVVFQFVLCNTLPFVLNFVEEIDPNFFVTQETLAWSLNDVNNLLVIFNSSTTACIYAACSEKYRRLLSNLFTRSCLCERNSMKRGNTYSKASCRGQILNNNHHQGHHTENGQPLLGITGMQKTNIRIGPNDSTL